MPGNVRVAEPGLVVVSPGSGAIRMWPVSVCHHVSTIGQRSPPMVLWYHIHASGLIGSPTDPSSAQAREIARLRILGAPAHERADRGRRGVEDRHAVALDDLPEASLVRPVGRALVHHDGRAVGERTVDDVAVPGHPADVGGAPVDVFVLHVEDPLGGGVAADQVAARSCGRCPSASPSCRTCRGCRACPRRPSARARRAGARLPASAGDTSGRGPRGCGPGSAPSDRAGRRRRGGSTACPVSASSAICLSGTSWPRR